MRGSVFATPGRRSLTRPSRSCPTTASPRPSARCPAPRPVRRGWRDVIRSGPSRRLVLVGAAAAGVGAAGPVRAAPAPGLEAVLDLAMAQASTAVLVSRGGEVLAERYAPGWDAERPREVASVAKSLLAVLIAMAVEDGALSGLDQAAADFIPAWRDDARAGITLRHMMSMTSGLDDAGLALRGVTGDQFAINAAAPLHHPPGTRWAYN